MLELLLRLFERNLEKQEARIQNFDYDKVTPIVLILFCLETVLHVVFYVLLRVVLDIVLAVFLNVLLSDCKCSIYSE